LVTVPFLLLLLDYWPLRRFGEGKILPDWRLVREKIPLLLMAIASTIIGFLAQRAASSVQSLDRYPLALRIENAVVSLAAYLWQMICPVRLAVMYPFPLNGIPVWQIALSALIVVAISLYAWTVRQQRPYILVGWLWYLGMLTPVIGLVQLGQQARADRYTYLPQIGISIALAWLAANVVERWKNRREVLIAAACMAIAVLTIMAFLQTRCWQNSETLWTATLANTTANSSAEGHLGAALLTDGHVDEAIVHLQDALITEPGRFRTRIVLGNAYSQKGRTADALAQYRQAVQLNPNFPLAHYNLGVALLDARKPEEAISELEECVRLDPTMVEAHLSLANALAISGNASKAIEQFQVALQLAPRNPAAMAGIDRIAWVLATCPDSSLRNGAEALRLAQQMTALSPNNPSHLCVLAAAQAETGQFDQAATTAEAAKTLASQQGNTALLRALQTHLNAYHAHQPFRDNGDPVGRPPL